MNESERQDLRQAVQHAILGSDGLDEELERSPEAYLHLMARADVAVDEASNLLIETVQQARRAGQPWSVIGQELGITRQAAQQRFGPARLDAVVKGAQKTIEGATAFNEMEILRKEGEEGNHLVSFGPLYLVVEHSDRRWEHLRVTSVRMGDLRRQLEQTGWVYVGSWFPFRYFKRALGD